MSSERTHGVLRRIYLRIVRATTPLLTNTGLDRRLERSQNFWVRHLWSLFAIYDVERMAMFGKPWWTYPAIDEVERFLEDRDGKARVFEYGAGSSTIWLASRASEVHSVEHDGDFLGVLEPLLAEASNVWLYHVPPALRRPDSIAVSGHAGDEGDDFADYVAEIGQVGGTFDLIVIDGRARVCCLEAAMAYLAPDGMILFDDADRPRYADGLGRCGLAVEYKRGLAPSVPLRETTALLRDAPASSRV